MEALAHRPPLDSHGQGAVRGVAFYDTLMRRRVDLPALARASAGLAGCVAGIRLHRTGMVVRVSPDRGSRPEPPDPASTTAPITLDDEETGTVWLEPYPPTCPSPRVHRPGQVFLTLLRWAKTTTLAE